MNKDRRKQIEHLISTIQALASSLEEAMTEVKALRDDEQEYFDNMPESFQQGEKGQLAEEAVSNLDDGLSEIENAFSSLESALSSLENAAA